MSDGVLYSRDIRLPYNVILYLRNTDNHNITSWIPGQVGFVGDRISESNAIWIIESGRLFDRNYQ